MTTLPTMRKLMFGVVGAVRVVGVVAVAGIVSAVVDTELETSHFSGGRK